MSVKTRFLPMRFRLLLTLVLAMGLLLGAFSTGQAATIPLISITAVTKDVSVTITGANFPLGQTFTARMGAFGTKGVNGTVVGTLDTGTSSTFTKTFNIPSSLKGAAQIAIRLDSPQGYFSYNWFINNAEVPVTAATATSTAGATATATPAKGIPTFSIVKVVKGTSVTIHTSNFPAAQTFTARMGKYGTYGIGGTVVGTTDSGSGGAFDVTYTIPAALAAEARIAIRLDSPQGYFSFNWFDNLDSTIHVTGATPGVTATPAPASSGIPKIFIQSVVKDSKVTLQGTNFPAGKSFVVRMGAFGTQGVGGTQVAIFDSGSGGTFTATYSIPAALAGSSTIAIRLETADGVFFAYNWFYNATTTN